MKGVNRSVTKALEILDLLGRVQGGLRLKDVALHLGWPESTTHRLLASLAERGYVQQRTHNGDYTLGWKIVTLAQSLSAEMRLLQDVRPCMEVLRTQAKGAVNLAVLNDTEVFYLDCLASRQSLSLYSPPGCQAPAYATALGKVLLAYLPRQEQESILGRINLHGFTEQTVSSIEALRGDLAQIRGQGYAVDRGEFVAGLNCVAAPVTGPDGQVVAAISVTMHDHGTGDRWDEEIVPLVCAAAADASRRHRGIAPTAQGQE